LPASHPPASGAPASLTQLVQPPGSQKATVQTPLTQVEVAWGRTQTTPHPPQLLGSLPTLVVQPEAGFPLQFAQLVLQEPGAHAPLTHAAEAFG
jgi:hypothetical protein